MNRIVRTGLVGVAVSLLLTIAGPLQQLAAENDNDRGQGPIGRVLLISIDGMHALDYTNCVNGGYLPASDRARKERGELHAHVGLQTLGFIPGPDGAGGRRHAPHGRGIL